jgi:hypothetical protein
LKPIYSESGKWYFNLDEGDQILVGVRDYGIYGGVIAFVKNEIKYDQYKKLLEITRNPNRLLIPDPFGEGGMAWAYVEEWEKIMGDKIEYFSDSNFEKVTFILHESFVVRAHLDFE